MIDGVAAMDRFLKLDRVRAGHLPGAADGRLQQVGGHRGRAEGHPGQADHQLDLDEGGRGAVPRARPAGAQVRRRGGRHGVRRGGPGRLPRAPPGDLRAGLPASSSTRSGSRAEDIIFDPNIFAVATGIEEHAAYGTDFIEATRWIKENLPHALVSGGVSNVSFSFRGNNAVREAIHAVFLYHAIKAGMDMGIVNAGALQPYDTVDAKLRDAIEDVVLNRRPDAADRLLTIAEDYRGSGEVADPTAEEWRSLPVRRADHARPRQGHRRARRRRHRGAAARDRGGRRSPARGHRGSADGRHERRRRPVRRRQDVPAAGREVGPGHEEGRRAPHPVHRGREGRGRQEAEQGRRRHGDGQGRRPRHRQEHRRRRAAVQQLRRHRPRRHGADPEDPRRGQGGRRRHHRPVRPHHAEPRRDGARRRPRWSARASRSRCCSAAPRRRGRTPRSRSTSSTTAPSCG